MAAVRLVNTKDIDRETWKAYRRRGVGGSDIAAILGFNAYRNAVSVWLDKTGRGDDVEENMSMKMGHKLEPIVAELFAEEYPEFKVRQKHFMLQHKRLPYMLANIDREIICPVRGRGVLEIKTTSTWNRREWDGNHVPDMYMFQIQSYLAVTEYKFGYFAVLIGGNDYRSFYVERDEEIIAYIEAKVQEFWQYVIDDVVPPLDGSDATREAIWRLYPSNEAKDALIELPDTADAILDELDEISKQEKALSERKAELQNRIMVMMGNNYSGQASGWSVTWKPHERRTIDSKALQSKYPDIYADVVKSSTSRPFKVVRSD